MMLDPADWLDRGLLFGTYEPGLRRLVKAVVREGDRCVDVGTHKGLFTLAMARRVGARGEVIGVDCDPRAFGEMTRNAERNGFRQVRGYPVALGDSPGSCEIALNAQLGNSSRFPNEFASEAVIERIEVPVRTLDDILEECRAFEDGRLSLVKIDAEGSEPLILRGMRRTLEELRPIVTLEVNFASLRTAGLDESAIYAPLAAQGYEVYRLDWSRDWSARGVLRLVHDGLDGSTEHMIDVVAVPSGTAVRERVERFIHGQAAGARARGGGDG